jgi:hypothetical protein
MKIIKRDLLECEHFVLPSTYHQSFMTVYTHCINQEQDENFAETNFLQNKSESLKLLRQSEANLPCCESLQNNSTRPDGN